MESPVFFHTSRHERAPSESAFAALHGFTVGAYLGRTHPRFDHKPLIAFNFSWRSWEDDSLMLPYLVVVYKPVDPATGYQEQKTLYIGYMLVVSAAYRTRETLRVLRREARAARRAGYTAYIRERWASFIRERREEQAWRRAMEYRCAHGRNTGGGEFCEACEDEAGA